LGRRDGSGEAGTVDGSWYVRTPRTLRSDIDRRPGIASSLRSPPPPPPPPPEPTAPYKHDVELAAADYRGQHLTDAHVEPPSRYRFSASFSSYNTALATAGFRFLGIRSRP